MGQLGLTENLSHAGPAIVYLTRVHMHIAHTVHKVADSRAISRSRESQCSESGATEFARVTVQGMCAKRRRPRHRFAKDEAQRRRRRRNTLSRVVLGCNFVRRASITYDSCARVADRSIHPSVHRLRHILRQATRKLALDTL